MSNRADQARKDCAGMIVGGKVTFFRDVAEGERAWFWVGGVPPESCPGEEGYKVPDSGNEFWRKSAWAAGVRCIGLENTIAAQRNHIAKLQRRLAKVKEAN